MFEERAELSHSRVFVDLVLIVDSVTRELLTSSVVCEDGAELSHRWSSLIIYRTSATIENNHMCQTNVVVEGLHT